MKTYQLQLPIDVEVKEELEKRGRELGLRNINSTVMFLLKNFASGRFSFSYDAEEAYKKKLDKMAEESLSDITSGKSKGYTNAKSLLNAIKKEAT